MGSFLNKLGKITGAIIHVQLLLEYAVPRGPAGASGPRHTEHQRIVGKTRNGPRLHCRGANLKVRQVPKQLAETRHLNVQQGQN